MSIYETSSCIETPPVTNLPSLRSKMRTIAFSFKERGAVNESVNFRISRAATLKPTAERGSVSCHVVPPPWPSLSPPAGGLGTRTGLGFSGQYARHTVPGVVMISPASHFPTRTITRQHPVNTISPGSQGQGSPSPPHLLLRCLEESPLPCARSWARKQGHDPCPR